MRKRTFQYAWCGLTEVDYVCERCCTIVLDPAKGCQHCHKLEAKKVKLTEEEKWAQKWTHTQGVLL